MTATYLIRFDDLCPTMDRKIWAGVERVLVEYGVRPMLAIVPDNQDEHLRVDQFDPGFWDRARTWQSRGWTIGMHGYQHSYITDRSGLIGLNNRSEFAGLSLEQQVHKLESGLQVFAKERVTPTVWIAPGHSFDDRTVAALGKVGIWIISDGFSLFPHMDREGLMWIPQQLWRFYPMPFGVWTICCHPNSWSSEAIAAFAAKISSYRDQITDVDTLVESYGGRTPNGWDRLAAACLPAMVRAKRDARAWARRLLRDGPEPSQHV